MRMKAIGLSALAVLALAALCVSARCGGPKSQTDPTKVTITGYVIDLNCWLGLGKRGLAHEDCAQSCARSGTPLAFLTGDGSIVYPVVDRPAAGPEASNTRLIPFAEEYVSATGRLVTRGRDRAIFMTNIKTELMPQTEPSFPGKETPNATIEGLVVDLNGWLGQGLSGESNKASAVAAARLLQPLVILGADNGIYYPVVKDEPAGPESNAKLYPFIAQKVKVKGTLIERGLARAIVIDKVEPVGK